MKMVDFYGFVRFPNGSELKQPLESNGSGLSVTDFQQSGGLQWLQGSGGITPGSIGFELSKAQLKFVSVSMLPRSDFGTGSLDVDLVQRVFLSDGMTENKKKFVKYESAPFHNMALEQVKAGFTFGVYLDGQEVTKSLSAQEVQKMFPKPTDKLKEFGN